MAGKTATSKNDKRPIVIRREEVVAGGHHGGAWKVAYADFVTAMMAFFLLMWLLNATTEAQRKGLADYFTQSNALSHNSSGSGMPFGGHTPFDSGSEISDRGAKAVMTGSAPQTDSADAEPQPDARTPFAAREDAHATDDAEAQTGSRPVSDAQPRTGSGGGGQATAASVMPVRADYLAQAASGSAPRLDNQGNDPTRLAEQARLAELQRAEKAAFQQAAAQLRDAIRSDPALADLARQLVIDMTPEGLRIQLLDTENQPMFSSGSADPEPRARQLLARVAPVLATLKEAISISGHTDAVPYRGGGKSNWDLSAERANATRRVLAESGLNEERFRSVTGNADRDPLLPNQPLAAANRRMAITVLRSVPAASLPVTGLPGASVPATDLPPTGLLPGAGQR